MLGKCGEHKPNSADEVRRCELCACTSVAQAHVSDCRAHMRGFGTDMHTHTHGEKETHRERQTDRERERERETT